MKSTATRPPKYFYWFFDAFLWPVGVNKFSFADNHRLTKTTSRLTDPGFIAKPEALADICPQHS
jgi:hypothetical protein